MMKRVFSWGVILQHNQGMAAISIRKVRPEEPDRVTLQVEHGPVSADYLRGLRDLIDGALKEMGEPLGPTTRFDREPLV